MMRSQILCEKSMLLTRSSGISVPRLETMPEREMTRRSVSTKWVYVHARYLTTTNATYPTMIRASGILLQPGRSKGPTHRMSRRTTAAPVAMCFQKNHQCGFRSRTTVSPSLMSFGGYGGITPAYELPATTRGKRRGPTRSQPLDTVPGMDATAADRLLAGLDDSQRRAVIEPGRPLAILAPAGSGKTRVLTHRIAWHAITDAIEPGHVLALTFTRKAAGEMRSRLRRLGIRDGLTAGTFHAVALAQLRALHEHRGTAMPGLLDRKARAARAPHRRTPWPGAHHRAHRDRG